MLRLKCKQIVCVSCKHWIFCWNFFINFSVKGSVTWGHPRVWSMVEHQDIRIEQEGTSLFAVYKYISLKIHRRLIMLFTNAGFLHSGTRGTCNSVYSLRADCSSLPHIRDGPIAGIFRGLTRENAEHTYPSQTSQAAEGLCWSLP
jgi:hypothetical protein